MAGTATVICCLSFFAGSFGICGAARLADRLDARFGLGVLGNELIFAGAWFFVLGVALLFALLLQGAGI